MNEPKKILIIDDDFLVSDIYSMELQKAGFAAITANNGESGLSKIQLEKPNLILLDIVMPGLDGLQVLEKIRSNPELNNLKVILLSNLKDESTIKNGLAHGANGYLIKTALTPQQIVSEVRKELQET